LLLSFPFPFKPLLLLYYILSLFLSFYFDLKRFMKMSFLVYISAPLHTLPLLLLLHLLVIHQEANAARDGQCDLFTGRWVVDKSYPLYDPAACPFIEREFSCQKNGRRDLDYTEYRWQPLRCNLLRYVRRPFIFFFTFLLSVSHCSLQKYCTLFNLQLNLD
jgi:hypothetical protein